MIKKIENEIARKISSNLNVDVKIVKKCIQAYWKSVNNYINKFNFLEMTEEEYDNIKFKGILMPRLGTFEMQWKNILKKRRRDEYAKNHRC